MVEYVAICFGHQIVALALGGKCVPNSLAAHTNAPSDLELEEGKDSETGKKKAVWETGVYDVELGDVGRGLFGVDSIVCLFHLFIFEWANEIMKME